MKYWKDFDGWNKEKKRLDTIDPELYFHEREVWWCRLGVNIGYEQDGKNSQYARPVIILKRYSTNACLVVPLTAQDKKGTYYFDVGDVDGKGAKAVLSQLRFVDKKRLINKVDVIEGVIFEKLLSAIIQINLTQK
ncbi:type II toxin-antitoxin system PemK/MazF family toxin [Patescibacteria group bacterium]|nr:type II toxin-antitoxin system PemK/MazF family toxin [Patescibacteria group bacterium]